MTVYFLKFGKRYILCICLLLLLSGCNAHWRAAYSFLWIISPGGSYEAVGVQLDYTRLESWAAHPEKSDGADITPEGPYANNQSAAAADAFYIHPTTFISRKSWNRPDPSGDDALLNGVMLPNQASVLNGCCRVYAPHYRQATFYSFADRKGRGDAALDLAYADVNAAFTKFLDASGPDRPIVLAAHSQGSAHLQRLIAERFADEALRRRLVVAYAPGYPLPRDLFLTKSAVPFCSASNDVGCIATWNVKEERGYVPNFFRNAPIFENGSYRRPARRTPICTNPTSWAGQAETPQLGYLGGFYAVKKQGPQLSLATTSVQCVDGWLVIDRPEDERFREVMMSGGWYHVYEYALFWGSIRENLSTRLTAYQAELEQAP